MGILGKLPILALGRPGSYKIFDGYILENILSFKVRPLFEFECIKCAKVKHCCRLKSIPVGVAEFSALQQVYIPMLENVVEKYPWKFDWYVWEFKCKKDNQFEKYSWYNCGA